jgi:asparaginyl-tRNA synthetase
LSSADEFISLARLMTVRDALLDSLRSSFAESRVREVRVPTLVDVTGACENVDTLFHVTSARAMDHRGTSSHAKSRFLTQTGQLALEFALAEFDACWCLTPSYRADVQDARHLDEFDLVEEEFALPAPAPSGSHDIDVLVKRMENIIATALRAAEAHSSASTRDSIRAAVDAPFARLEYDEAIDIVNGYRSSSGSRPKAWGEDLSPADEATLMRHTRVNGNERPTFVTHFPEVIKFFNMKLDADRPDRVLSADLLLPVAGEAAGAAVREDDFPTLRDRLLRSRMFNVLQASGSADLSTFTPYLQLIEKKLTPRHAGYGIGLERLMQYVLGTDDIREVSVAVRLSPTATRDGERNPM